MAAKPLPQLLAEVDDAVASIPAEKQLFCRQQLLMAAVLQNAEDTWPGINDVLNNLSEMEEAATQPLGVA